MITETRTTVVTTYPTTGHERVNILTYLGAGDENGPRKQFHFYLKEKHGE